MKAGLALGLALGLGTTLFAQGSAPRRPSSKAGIAIAEIVWTDGVVSRAEPPDKTAWRRVGAGDRLRTGDSLRTSDDGLTRIEFPWMTVTLGPGSMLTVPPTAVLSTVLDQGRAEFSGPGRDIVKIQVGEGEVRGGGRVVLRRATGRTSASAIEGTFRVRALGRVVTVEAGRGTRVLDGRPPERAATLPPPPGGLHPSTDVGYVRAGQPIELRWSGVGDAHYLELLALDADAAVLARDVGPPPVRLALPWLGTYRWRVSGRDARGLESAPSSAGMICSVER